MNFSPSLRASPPHAFVCQARHQLTFQLFSRQRGGCADRPGPLPLSPRLVLLSPRTTGASPPRSRTAPTLAPATAVPGYAGAGSGDNRCNPAPPPQPTPAGASRATVTAAPQLFLPPLRETWLRPPFTRPLPRPAHPIGQSE